MYSFIAPKLVDPYFFHRKIQSGGSLPKINFLYILIPVIIIFLYLNYYSSEKDTKAKKIEEIKKKLAERAPQIVRQKSTAVQERPEPRFQEQQFQEPNGFTDFGNFAPF